MPPLRSGSGPYWSHWILKKILDSDWVLSKLLGRVSSNHCSELFMTIGMGLVREPFWYVTLFFWNHRFGYPSGTGQWPWWPPAVSHLKSKHRKNCECCPCLLCPLTAQSPAFTVCTITAPCLRTLWNGPDGKTNLWTCFWSFLSPLEERVLF